MIVSIWINLCLSSGKKSALSFNFSLGYWKDIANLLVWLFWPCLALHTQNDTITCRKLLCLTAGKKVTSSHMFFWRYCKDIETFYFGYFGQAWLCKPKMIELPCRKLWCLSACRKWTSLFSSFLRYLLILQNLAIWVVDNILAHNSRTRILPDMELLVKYE